MKKLSVFNYWEYPFILNMVRGHLKGKCLDVGCYLGGVMALAKSKKVMGLDKNIAFLQGNTPRKNVVCAIAESIPVKNEVFDTVFCGFVLSYVQDKASAVREMFRVLKKGGRAMVVLHHPNGSIGKVNREFVEGYNENFEFLRELKSTGDLSRAEENPFISECYSLYKRKSRKEPSVGDFLEKLSAQRASSSFFVQNKFRSISEIINLFTKNGFSINSYFDVAIPLECGHIYESALLSRPVKRMLLVFILEKNPQAMRLNKRVFFEKSLSGNKYRIEAHTQKAKSERNVLKARK